MRARRPIHLLVILLLASACHRDQPEKITPPAVGEAFPSVLIPPGGAVSARSGSLDALQITFLTAQPMKNVADFYRRQFAQSGWVVVSDLADSSGTIAIHVDWEKSGQPMWVRISKVAGGTQVDLAGAVPGRDTTFARKLKESRDTANNVLLP